MKHFAQALSLLINETSPTPCNEISPHVSRSLYRKNILLKENESGKTFNAFVVDCCCEDQKGIIVRARREEVKGLIRKHKMMEAEVNPKEFVEVDLRNLFSGKYFTYLKTL